MATFCPLFQSVFSGHPASLQDRGSPVTSPMAPPRQCAQVMRAGGPVAAIALCLLLVVIAIANAEALVRIPLHSPPLKRSHAVHHQRIHGVRHHHPAHAAMMQEQHYPQPHHAWHKSGEKKLLSHVALANIDDYLFSASVSMGSPPQNFTVMLDTGSTDAWVPGQRCASCGSSHRRFRRSDSTTLTDLNQRFEGLYGSGTSNGDVVRDVLTLGEYTVPGFVFALITNETGDIPGFATDGVLGLAFPGMGKINGQPTLLDAIVASHPEMETVFAFRLTKESDPTPSEFHLGGLDLSGVGRNPSVAYFPVLSLPTDDELTYWTIALDDFHTLSPPHSEHDSVLRSRDFCRPFCYAIVDSGSSLIYAPSQIYGDVIKAITRNINHCDLINNQCYHAKPSDFPSLSFSFGNGHTGDSKTKSNTFILRPENYVDCDELVCTINIQNHGEMGDDLYWWVLGDSFLQAYYTAFDFGPQKRVGIACAAGNPDCHLAP